MCIRDREYIAAENAVMKAGKIIAQDTTEGLVKQIEAKAVSYTHLDVYKRQADRSLHGAYGRD